jgi:hypothetical protein
MTCGAFAVYPIIENIVAVWQVKVGSHFAFLKRSYKLNSFLVRERWSGELDHWRLSSLHFISGFCPTIERRKMVNCGVTLSTRTSNTMVLSNFACFYVSHTDKRTD